MKLLLVSALLGASAGLHLVPGARVTRVRAVVLACADAADTPPPVPKPPSVPKAPRKPAPPPVELESYDAAEAKGIELFQAGEYMRAIRMFELAITLPGEALPLAFPSLGAQICPALKLGLPFLSQAWGWITSAGRKAA